MLGGREGGRDDERVRGREAMEGREGGREGSWRAQL